MDKLTWEKVELTLADAFEISYGRTEKKTNIVTRIGPGLGVSAPSITCSETVETVLEILPQLAYCIGDDPCDIDGFHIRADQAVSGNPSAKAAVDFALHDRAARMVDLPLYRYLGLPDPNGKESDMSIGIDTVEGTLRRMTKFPDTEVFKIKVGYPGDIDRLEQIATQSGKRLRIDANGGWDFETAVENIHRLNELNIELIEQPLPVELRGRLGELRRIAEAPIFVDEGCRRAEDVPAYVDRVDGINVKLMKCGGIRPALDLVATARAHGLQLMLGCMLESAIGTTAGAHLAALFDFLDLDSHLLVIDDPFSGMIHENGAIKLPDGVGLGLRQAD